MKWGRAHHGLGGRDLRGGSCDLQGWVPLQEVSPYYLSCCLGAIKGPSCPGLRLQGQPYPSCLRPGQSPSRTWILNEGRTK